MKKSSEISPDEAKCLDFNEFGNLYFDRRITKAISTYFKFKSPTLVQSKMIPIALRGGDLLVKARTGSGKTLGYSIPLVSSLLNKFETQGKMGSLKALIIVPTKELSEQVCEVISKLIIYCDNILSVEQSSTILNGQFFHLHNLPTILITTPMSILSLVTQFSKHTSKPLDLRQSVEMVVVDEADLMGSFGFSAAMQQLGQMLPSSSSNHYQVILCSATLSDDVKQLKSLLLHKPAIVKLETNDTSSNMGLIGDGEIAQYYYPCTSNNDKFLILYTLLSLNLLPKRCLIFTNTLNNAYRLMIFFERFAIPSGVLSPSMPYSHRHTILQTFNQNVLNILIATEDAMDEVRNNDEEKHTNNKKKSKVEGDEDDEYVAIHRGLDLQEVECVINFDLPTSESGYIHRIGRTGRGGSKGTALTLISHTNQEKSLLEMLLKSNAILDINPPNCEAHQGLQMYSLDHKAVEAFQYRVTSVLKGITNKCVEETKLQILQREALHNKRLKSYFEENPADALTLKKALRNNKNKRAQNEQLHYIPNYLMESVIDTKQTAIQLAIKNQTSSKSSHNTHIKLKSNKSFNPLHTFDSKSNYKYKKFTIQNQLRKREHINEDTPIENIPTLSGRKLWKLRHKKKLKKGGLAGNFLKK